uniref:Uncharacterized protein n=1 Tax=Panagrolaimus davidi TaxID=227884 RepID=A0A914QSE1_9BILA
MEAIEFFGDDSTEVMRMNHSECERRIKEEIDGNQTFTNVIKKFGFTRADDILPVLIYYSRLLLTALPRKGKEYIQNLFDIADENILARWVVAVYKKPKSDNELELCLKTTDFYECLVDLKAKNIEVPFSSFYETIRTDFKAYFIDYQNLYGIFEIYQCLLRCSALPSPNNSSLFYAAVKKLWNKLNIQNTVLNLEADEKAEIHAEHERLEKLVDNFEGTSHTAIVELIKDHFLPTQISLITDGTKVTLKAEGFNIIMSKIYHSENGVNSQITTTNKNITDIQIIAYNELIMDQDLTLPGINFSCSSNNVAFPKPITINLSGDHGVNDKSTKIKADDGKMPGENGVDGKDGKAGKSSGNFTLVAMTIFGKENLKLILNGGNGDFGQNGGDGADGKDCVGMEFDKVFNIKGVKQGANLVTGSLFSRAFDKKKETKKDDGSLEVHCDSPYYFSTHTFELIKGPDGGKGGLGGKNGKGGQGGYRGTYNIEIDSKIINDEIDIQASDGTKGSEGHPGKNADYGKEGWDIALIDCTLGKRTPFGQKHNKKLYWEFSDTRKENAIYMHSENKKEGNKCYVEIHERDCIKKKLADKEKWTQFKSESERSGESIA